MESIGYLLVFLVFISFGVAYFLYLTKPKKKIIKKGQTINPAFVASKWEEINQMINTGGPANFRQSIVEADKLVDYVLKSKVPGETMGERLKSAKKIFTPTVYDNLWKAHKVRNKVVHEADSETLSFDAKTAIKNFEKALKELKIIK